MNLTSEEDFDFISETSERMNTLYGTDISWEKNDEEFDLHEKDFLKSLKSLKEMPGIILLLKSHGGIDEEFGSFLVTNMTYDSLSDLDL